MDDDLGRASLLGFAAAALDAQPGLAAVVDRDGVIEAVNHTWRLRARACGADLRDVGPGVDYLGVCSRSVGCEDARVVLDGMRAVLAGGLAEFHHRYQHEVSGVGRRVDLRITGLAGPAGGAVVTHEDTTADQDARQALEAVGEWSAAVVRTSPDLYSLTDPDGTVRWISPSVENILGWRVEDLLGTNSYALTHPDDLPRLAAKAEQDRQVAGVATPSVFRIRCKDGSYRWVEAVLTNLTDHPAVHGMIVTARDVTARVAMEDDLRTRATTDELTGLANRAAVLAHLTERLAVDTPQPVRVAYVDLDGFRVVNDSFGHTRGDALLAQVARRLRDRTTPEELIARVGGDEFVAVLDPDEPLATGVDRLLQAFDTPFQVGDVPVTFRASIGVAESDPHLSEERPEALVARADTAMYEAKRTPGVRWLPFEESMHERAVRHLTLASELQDALASGEVRPVFQPIYSLSDGALIGVEALARWFRREGTVWTPDRFLPVCQATGMASTLDAAMLDATCTLIRDWSAPPSAWASVNVSSAGLEERSTVDQVDRALARSGLAAERLVLEITEQERASAILEGDVLTVLHRRGVSLALDDFGTGWSSLSRLAALPVSMLKIDRQFVSGICEDPTSRAIAASVVALGRVLGMSTIAEGVETPGQLATVRELGATAVQGFLTGRPMALPDIRHHVDLPG